MVLSILVAAGVGWFSSDKEYYAGKENQKRNTIVFLTQVPTQLGEIDKHLIKLLANFKKTYLLSLFVSMTKSSIRF